MKITYNAGFTAGVYIEEKSWHCAQIYDILKTDDK